MEVSYEYERDELDQQIRERFTAEELTALRRQLAGAVKAIDLLRQKAPHVVAAFFAGMKLVDTNDVPQQAQHALAALADELRVARAQQIPPGKPIPSRQALRLVFSAEG